VRFCASWGEVNQHRRAVRLPFLPFV
jgi:hypothetical protein